MARHGGAPAAQDRSHSAPGLNPSSRAELAEGGREDANNRPTTKFGQLLLWGRKLLEETDCNFCWSEGSICRLAEGSD